MKLLFHFHLCGTVNKQNFRYWASGNPRELHQRPLHSPKVTAWYVVSSLGVVGPYFFEEDDVTVTVTSDRYCGMLQNFFQPRLAEFQEHYSEHFWFQQDGATSHNTRRSRAILQERFPGHLISSRGDVERPPCSPDLSPCDFFSGATSKFRSTNIGLKLSNN